MTRLRRYTSQLKHYPSAVVGFVLIGVFVALSVYTMATLPLSEALRLWRAGETTWRETPRNAAPLWLNRLPGVNLPVTETYDSRIEPGTKTTTKLAEGIWETRIIFPVDFHYDGFPKELTAFVHTTSPTRRPFMTMTWRTPDGRQVPLYEKSLLSAVETLAFGHDAALTRRLGGHEAPVGLFLQDGTSSAGTPLKGRYELHAEVLTFEPDAEVDVRFIVYGQLHGVAGTDHRRRDLSIALLWGTPIALAMGLMGALGTTVLTMAIAAFGTWYGRRVDATIQRLTEIRMMIPTISVLIMIGVLVNRSLLALTAIFVMLGIFGSNIKSQRALFLQIKESPYIEAARAYSAGNMRIVMHYMLPRALPTLVPTFVILIPSYVFFEVSLSIIGLGDLHLPTWGKVLHEAQTMGALHNGYYYWVLGPALLLVLSGGGFALVGFALDRIFNPRLRAM